MSERDNNYCAAIAWLRTLRPGWDSHGSASISEAAIHTAEVMLEPPAIVPRSNGGVQLEWRTEGLDLEVLIAPDGRLEAEVEIEKLKKRSEGHDKPCFDCGRRTNDLSGDPGQWSIPLCHSGHPGVVQWHHAGCVSNRLAERDALKARLDALPDLVADRMIEVLRNERDTLGRADKALCQCDAGCGKLGPVHVVRSTRIGTHGEQVSEAKLYAAEHCPICKPSEGK